MCADKRQLNALEDEMLHMIQSISGEFSKGIIAYISKYTTVGNILDDEELIHALQAVKQAAVDVKERIANAQESQKMVDTHRQYFQPVCCMCSGGGEGVTDTTCMCSKNRSFYFRLQPEVQFYIFVYCC